MKKIKIQRPNAMKIIILLILFFDYNYINVNVKTEIYRIIKKHYGIKNTRSISNQIEMLKASGILIQEGEKIRIAVTHTLPFEVFRIINETPDDVFPIPQEEIDHIHRMVKNPGYIGPAIGAKQENKGPWYGKDDLYSMLFTMFSSMTDGIDESFLNWASVRLFTVWIFHDLRYPDSEPLRWDYPVVDDLFKKIRENMSGDCGDFEDVFSMVKLEVNRNERLKKAIQSAYFPPFREHGVDPYIMVLRGSLSALRFIFGFSHLGPEQLEYRSFLDAIEEFARRPFVGYHEFVRYKKFQYPAALVGGWMNLYFDDLVLSVWRNERLREAEKIRVIKGAMTELFPNKADWIVYNIAREYIEQKKLFPNKVDWIEESVKAMLSAPTEEHLKNEVLLRMIPMLADVNRGRDKPMFAILKLKAFADFLNWGKMRRVSYNGHSLDLLANYRHVISQLSQGIQFYDAR